MAKKDQGTTEGQAPATTPMPAPYPTFSQTPLGQRMAMMGGSPDGTLPVWAQGQQMTNFDPSATPLAAPATTTGNPYNPAAASPPPASQSSAAPSTPPWAAANPLARPGEAPRFGDDIRSDIFRQIYRTGKRQDTAAGDMLMNIGKPSVPGADPLAAMNPTAEPEAPPFYLDSSGNTAPPSGGIPANTGYGAQPSQPMRPSGPGGRLASRMQANRGQGMMGQAPVAPQGSPAGQRLASPREIPFSPVAPRPPATGVGRRASTTQPRRTTLRRP